MFLVLNMPGNTPYTINSKAPVMFGVDASLKTGATAASLGWKKVILISDEGIKATGIAGKVLDSLKAAGIAVVEVYDVQPDPKDTAVEKTAALANAENVDGIVAVGGGSVLDTAKGVNFLTTNEAPLSKWYLFDHPKENPGKGMILIPTTAGTGSEISVWSVITDSASHQKMALYGENCRPVVAIVDPALTLGIPPKLTVLTGIDAFSHCFESFTNITSTPVSEMFALEGMKLGAKNMPVAYKNGKDIEARTALSLAALYAPMAFSDATTHIGHGMAHAIGGATHVTHGICCALSTAMCLEYFAEAVPAKIRTIGEILGATFSDSMTPAEIGKTARAAWEKFCNSMDVPTTLSASGVKESDFPEIVKLFIADISQGPAPRKATEAEFTELLKKTF